IMPLDEKVYEINELFDNSSFSDRLVFTVSFSDTTQVYASAKELIAYCNTLVDTLKATTDSIEVKDFQVKVDESEFLKIYDVLYQHLPLFLEEDDYATIEEYLKEGEVEDRVQGAYKSLLSPAGFAFKDAVLKDPLGFTRLAFDKLQSFQIDENFTLENGYIVSTDHRHLLFFIQPAQSGRETLINKGLLDKIESAVAYADQQFEGAVHAQYFGAVAVAVDNATQIRWDVTATVSAALIFLLFIIIYFFKKPSAFFTMVLPVLLGGIVALGMLFLFKGTVSIISIGVGSVLLGIILDYSLHIFTHHRNVGRVVAVISDLTWPILISSMTTAIAFLCLYLVRSEALHDLGLFSALAVFAGAILALWVLPLFLKDKEGKTDTRQTFLDKWAAYPLGKNKYVLLVVGLVTLVCLFNVSEFHFESDLNKVNFMSEKTKAAEAQLNSITSATMRGVYLVAHGHNLEEALEYNAAILPIVDSLKREGIVKGVSTPGTLLLTKKQQAAKIALWNQFWTSEKKANLILRVQSVATSLNFKPEAFSGFYNFIDRNFDVAPPDDFKPVIDLFLKEYISEKDSLATVLTLLRLNQEDKPPVYQRFGNMEQVNILDKEYLVQKFVAILKTDFDYLVWFSLALVFIILHISFGRIELAIVSFLPILLSWVWTIGLMNIFGLRFNIINVIITTFIFGLGIDYCIFIMRALLQEYKTGEKHLTSYKTSVLLSAMTTLIGIGVMIFAKHPALQSIAGLAIIGIGSVLFISFSTLPFLFRWLIYQPDGNRREYPRTVWNTFKTLYVYGLIALGSIIVTVLGGLVFLVPFLGKEKKKFAVHWLIWKLSTWYVNISFFPSQTRINEGEDFIKPAIIVSNHQSHIDTPVIFSLHPKLVLLTKGWVYNFPLYHFACKMADFFTVDEGMESLLPKLKERVANGYHIAVFPEGSRSPDDKVKRFHKGSFLLAEQLEMDIILVYIYGTGRFLRKGSFWGESNDVFVKVSERISFDDPRFVGSYSERTKKIFRYYREQYESFKKECQTPNYYRRQLVENYLYKGPVLEYYTRVKTKMEDYYKVFHELVPQKAVITDLGCGYGYMPVMLSYLSEERKITGVDYDEEKIALAANLPDPADQLTFIHSDIAHFDYQPSDVFIFSDVLHYLTPDEQWEVLDKALANLSPAGKIIVRDGDSDLAERHKGTWLTEFFSTNIGFNKTRNPLHFLSGAALEAWAKKNKLELTRIDLTKKTSNIIFVFQPIQL
ncbi:MAG: MMPL family transporter, partial [Saprospiraceae bacterium]|nr:MMPL family transporter [Saprospiraceae bacterium]